ncbi:MAG: hypothetical protein M1825_004304 [Sarcosagium campestre]|nr:MAG: hypothetical protein M1825_004304 [Sarcosagium campestre]
MAPLPLTFGAPRIPEALLNFPYLDRRSLALGSADLRSYLASIGLQEKQGNGGHGDILKRSLQTLKSRTPTLDVPSLLNCNVINRRKEPVKEVPGKGHGVIDPFKINNKGFFVLFAFIGVGLVMTAIWFFFWAKNGGFVFREGDWEDYKTTVLRRKDKNGKTMSNATKTTDLGGGSVLAEYDTRDMSKGHRAARPKMGRDDDVREYRHEKPARVGGLNRKADGGKYDPSATDRSDASTSFMQPPPAVPVAAEKKKRFFDRAKNAANKPRKVFRQGNNDNGNNRGHQRVPSSAYSFTQGDDNSTVADSASEYNARRHNYRTSHPLNQHRPAPPRASPRSQPRPYRDVPSMPGTFSEYDDVSTVNGDDSGTKTYNHYIPGLSRGTRTEESMSDRGPPRQGYRRGGGGRRDSLSDSD